MSDHPAEQSAVDRYWLQHYQTWKESKQTQSDYCKQHELNRHGFNSGCQRLREKGILDRTISPRAKTLFSRVAVIPEETQPRVSRIGLAQDGWLELETAIPFADAAKLLSALP